MMTTSQACIIFQSCGLTSCANLLSEPPMFVASSLVHFNDTHRGGIIRNIPQSSSAVVASAAAEKKSPTNSRTVVAVAPLASSSGRVVNATPTRALPTGKDLRDWIVQPAAHRDKVANDSPSKGKGKAKVVGEERRLQPSIKVEQSPVKLEPSPVKLEPPPAALHTVVRPKGKPPSTAVKMEPSSTPFVFPPHPQEGKPVLPPIKPEPDTGPHWSRRSSTGLGGLPGIVKVENFSACVPGPLLPKCSPSPRSSPADGHPSSSGSSLTSSSSAASSASSPAAPSGDASAKSTAVKRRLGMGRATGGYTNKKFKPMVPGGP